MREGMLIRYFHTLECTAGLQTGYTAALHLGVGAFAKMRAAISLRTRGSDTPGT